MKYFAGLDVSLKTTSICIMTPQGEIIRQGVTETDPKVIAAWLREGGRRYHRVGLEAGSTSMWLYGGLAKARLPVVCMEARHAHSILSTRLNKTDRNDARGLADLLRTHLFRAVHVKSQSSQTLRALLTARRLLMTKLMDLENGIGGLLRSVGQKLGKPSRKLFDLKVRACLKAVPELEGCIGALLAVRNEVWAQYNRLHERVVAATNADAVCRRLMTIPGVGPLTAITYRVTIDVPERFARSRSVGAHLGLTPRTYQSGDSDRRGRMSRAGDREGRSTWWIAAVAILNPRCRPSPLKAWTLAVAERRGKMKAIGATARRLAVLMHRIWIDGTEYRSA